MRVAGVLSVALIAAGVIGGTVAALPQAGAATVPADKTRTVNTVVPARHEVHSPFKITGTVQADTAAGWTAVDGLTVAYYYRSSSTGTWKHVASSKTNTHGNFGWQATVVKFGHLQWQVRVAQQQVGSKAYQATGSEVKGSFFVDRSYVTNFVALHLSGGTSLGAIMRDFPPNVGSVTDAQVSGTAKFYYRPKGSKTWKYLGSSRTDANGAIGLDEGSELSGTFRIVFPAQGNFLGSSANQSLS